MLARRALFSLLRNSALRPAAAAYCTTPLQQGSKEHIDSLIDKDKNKVVVFMKGTPEFPQCGFSNAVVKVLDYHGVTGYGSFNVLENEHIRQGIKDYSSWPTIPQVYIGGEFVGGCDIIIEMHKNGELIDELKKVGIQSALLESDEE